MSLPLKVPSVGESVTEVEIGDWLKHEGEAVAKDENVVVIETDKATVEIAAPAAGSLGRVLKQKGERVAVGEVIGYLETGAVSTPADAPPQPTHEPLPPAKAETESAAPPPVPTTDSAPRIMPAAARVLAQKGTAPAQVQATGPGGRVLKEDVERAAAQPPAASPPPPPLPAGAAPATPAPGREEEVVPMSLLRRKIAQHLVQAQQQAALLTTFNEIDLTTVQNLRRQVQADFQKRYGIKLGFMSFFVKAAIEALKEIPQLNAEIRGTDMVYRNYHDIGIAIGGGRGLVVPVLRDAGRLSFAEIEQAIADLAQRARANKIQPDELAGGTFTLTNGGVYGSLLSTPIINPPQSGVLGLHAIQERPVALDGQVVIRPMMYVALTYDHRVVDGRGAVTFLRRIKALIEQPARMLMEV